MKSSTYALFIGLGLSVAVAIPVVGGAIAQSGPVPDVEQYDDRDREMDREGWRRPDERDDSRFDRPADRDGRRGEARERWHSGQEHRWGRRHTRQRGRGHRGRFLRRYDRNGDGIVTRIEFAEIAKRRFETLDANRDGSISSEELANRRSRRRTR